MFKMLYNKLFGRKPVKFDTKSIKSVSQNYSRKSSSPTKTNRDDTYDPGIIFTHDDFSSSGSGSYDSGDCGSSDCGCGGD